MTDLQKAAQQALEALCSAVEPKKGKVYARGFEPIDCYAMHEQAITALREALARENAMHEVARLGQEIEQPEQEPVAKVVSTAPDRIWLDLGFDPQDETEVLFGELHDVTWSADNASGYGIEYVRTTPPAAQQEPTPWRDMVVVTLVREGIDKHRARELADHFAAERNNE